jgi:hypothetical protein
MKRYVLACCTGELTTRTRVRLLRHDTVHLLVAAAGFSGCN